MFNLSLEKGRIKVDYVMKKMMSVMLVALFAAAASAQVKKPYYCEVKAVDNGLNDAQNVVLDFGNRPVYQAWKKLTSIYVLVDDNGKWIGFNSMVDAANFLADKGWTLTQTYSTVHESETILHWVFCKEAESPEEAIKGIMTRKEYKKLFKK